MEPVKESLPMSHVQLLILKLRIIQMEKSQMEGQAYLELLKKGIQQMILVSSVISI